MELDAWEMIKNMNAWTYEELLPYHGKHVAWRVDGKVILAADADPVKLVESLDRQGVDRLDYMVDYIPVPERVYEPGEYPFPLDQS